MMFDDVVDVDVDVEKCACCSVVSLPLKGALGHKVRELSRVGGFCLVGFLNFQSGLQRPEMCHPASRARKNSLWILILIRAAFRSFLSPINFFGILLSTHSCH